MSFMFNLEDYETVEERLVKFWKDHPDGQIHTVLLDSANGRYIVHASIYRTEADARPWTTGLAEETVSARGVNSTSALENAETSAIGRSLASAGYATKGKRPSREEMTKVAAIQKTQNVIAETKAKMAQTATEYVPVPTENPWAIDDGAPVQTIDGAVALLKQEMGARGEGDIPNCTKCHDHKPMTWKSGMGKNGKPYGKFDCWTCKDVIWYEISKEDGSWQPQKNKW
jgi:hypothetical protein